MAVASTKTGGLLPISLNVRNKLFFNVRCKMVRIWGKGKVPLNTVDHEKFN